MERVAKRKANNQENVCGQRSGKKENTNQVKIDAGIQKQQSPEARESTAFLSNRKKASVPGVEPTQGPGRGDEDLAIVEPSIPNWDFCSLV